jgi:hypothetical protein
MYRRLSLGHFFSGLQIQSRLDRIDFLRETGNGRTHKSFPPSIPHTIPSPTLNLHLRFYTLHNFIRQNSFYTPNLVHLVLVLFSSFSSSITYFRLFFSRYLYLYHLHQFSTFAIYCLFLSLSTFNTLQFSFSFLISQSYVNKGNDKSAILTTFRNFQKL